MRQVVEPAPVQALAALFDDGLPVPGPGDPLPPLWHWVALARWAPFGATGADGHPRPIGLPTELQGRRRMFAGGRVRLHRPLHVGERVEVHEELGAVRRKVGRAGSFALVELRQLVHDESGELAVEDVRDLVYRDPAPPAERRGPGGAEPGGAEPGGGEPGGGEPRGAPSPLLTGAAGHWLLRTHPAALLRFSSATANAHRIHYDHRYATQVEGYPDLVVHGPLVTLAMAEVARLGVDGWNPGRVEHRNTRPLFCGRTADIASTTSTGGEVEVVVSHPGATIATIRSGR